ncbi:MAG: ribosomal protein small subunit ribosomal protein [Candidatus Parcubacteria bacterium]|jgi:small subunit ribosomal protein S9
MATKSESKYFEAVGRRKTSIARVRMVPASKITVSVNDIDFKEYFKTKELQDTAIESLTKILPEKAFAITVKANGGGINGQAESVRLGIARALEEFDAELRGPLKKAGFLTRDGRAKERRKFGLKKARKAPQWSKR